MNFQEFTIISTLFTIQVVDIVGGNYYDVKWPEFPDVALLLLPPSEGICCLGTSNNVRRKRTGPDIRHRFDHFNLINSVSLL